MQFVDSDEKAAFRSAVLWSQRFPDRWAVLNAAAEDFQQTAKADPWQEWPAEQVEELIDLVQDFREAYTIIARGCQGDGDTERFVELGEGITDRLEELGSTFAPRLLEDDGLVCAFLSSTDAGPGTLIKWSQDLVYDLFFGLDGANAGSIFVCEHCGRIGAGRYRNKRFCDANCRAAEAYRRKRGE